MVPIYSGMITLSHKSNFSFPPVDGAISGFTFLFENDQGMQLFKLQSHKELDVKEHADENLLMKKSLQSPKIDPRSKVSGITTMLAGPGQAHA